jgi:hypothetical protein
MFFFHTEYSFVVLRGLVEILDVDRDVPDTRFLHNSSLIRLAWTGKDKTKMPIISTTCAARPS